MMQQMSKESQAAIVKMCEDFGTFKSNMKKKGAFLLGKLLPRLKEEECVELIIDDGSSYARVDKTQASEKTVRWATSFDQFVKEILKPAMTPIFQGEITPMVIAFWYDYIQQWRSDNAIGKAEPYVWASNKATIMSATTRAAALKAHNSALALWLKDGTWPEKYPLGYEVPVEEKKGGRGHPADRGSYVAILLRGRCGQGH